MHATTSTYARRELARRASGGLEIALYWSPSDDGTTIEIRQPATGELLVFRVAQESALDAFYHPFAHVPVAGADPILVHR